MELSDTGDVYMRVTSEDDQKAGIELFRPGAGSTDWRMANATGWLYFRGSGDDFATVTTAMAVAMGGNALLDPDTVDISSLKLRIIRSQNNNDEAVGMAFSHTTNHSNVGAAIIHRRVGAGSQGTLEFATKGVTTTDADIPIRMTIDQNDNVGIGTTSPAVRLHVVDNSASDGIPLILANEDTTDGNVAWLLFRTKDTNDVQTNFAGIKTTFINHTAGAIEGRLDFNVSDTNGSVGTPKLSISQNGNVTGTYGSYHVSSDIRNKKDIVTIPGSLDKVLALRGVNFRWKDGSDNGTIQMGLIAQEVEKVVPEVIHTADDEKKTKAVEYEYMVGLLVEAIKEQQAHIEAQRKDIEKLKSAVYAD